MTEKEIYRRWINSAKYKEFQEKMEEKKRNIMELRLNYKKIIQQKMDTLLSDDELISYVDGLIEFNQMEDIDKEAYEWIDLERREINTKDKFMVDYVRTQLNLTFYLYKKELSQEFELCAKLRDAIQGELLEAIRQINLYFLPIDDDVITIEQYPDFAFRKMKNNWNHESGE